MDEDLRRSNVAAGYKPALHRLAVAWLWITLVLTTVAARGASTDGAWDSRFYLPGLRGEVRAITTRGQELFAVGEFTSADDVPVTNIARWTGTNWSALGVGVVGAVEAVAVWGSNVFVGGAFAQAGGVPASLVARWDGATWSALGSGIRGTRVNALALDATGALYAGGEFTNAGGVAVANIARWDGTNWSALGSGLSNDPYSAWVLALAVRGTDVFTGGFFTEAGGVSVNCVAKWNGVAWAPLGSGVDDRDYLPQVTALVVSGNDLYVGGAFATAGPVAAANVARWNGTAWSALGSGLDRYFGDIPVTALAFNGTRLLAGGRFIAAGGMTANKLAVWDGASWAELGGGAAGTIQALGADDGQVFVGGSFSVDGQPQPLSLGRWNGSSWSNLATGGGQGVWGARNCAQSPCQGDAIAAVAASGGRTYAGGSFSLAGGVPAANIACWNGSNWSALAGGVDGPVSALATHDGALLVAGRFGAAGNGPAANIARWDGTNWLALGIGINGGVLALAVNGSQLFAGGAFSVAGGVTASNVARWNGAAWTPVGGGVNGPVHALAIQGSNLFVGGKFTSAGGVNATNVAGWNGVAWFALGGGVSGVANAFARIRPPPVSALAVQGNELFVGGDFAFAGDAPATNIARWNGLTWSGVGGGLPGPVGLAPPPGVAVLLSSGGHLYAGGSFPRAGSATVNGLARWDGVTWSGFGTGVGGGIGSPASVTALAPNRDGLGVAGHFKFAGGKPASGFSLLRCESRVQIVRSNDAVIVSWPAGAPGYALEATEALLPAMWRPMASSPAAPGGEVSIVLPITNRSLFFRLFVP